MNYTIEKVTTLIGARRYGDKDANIALYLPTAALCVSLKKHCFLRSKLSVTTDRITSQNSMQGV